MMSAEPLGGFGGSIEHHLVDEPPALVHHDVRDGDFWLEVSAERDLDALLGDIGQTLASANNSTGLTQVRNEYGFIGTGQTVAVIDSGIAYDHSALGGGFGANYRVVGGWDFSEENDANPYDDGTEGSHGTHVAGIVGGNRTGTNDDGVAPGVDLVALRVFNDQGAGYFSWVENALRWVHQNRNAYENPITAVNLSLGMAYNSDTVPSWSTLEDEFAQLKADGIFIAVSAGNSFSNYNVPGLSYPAASSHVVPVMSVDDNGSLSDFSQRHTRAIAAPGRGIVSTVPDYVGNHNGVTDDYASFSGTSMASPYIAGASVLIREAMSFVGYTNITQDTIYDHMMATATSFFDSATGQNYKRLNLANALNSLIPTDDYGSTAATAFNLGTLTGSQDFAGLIGKVSDKDYFTFTAGSTGTVNLTLAATHRLEPNVTVTGSSATHQNDTWSFDVVAGQSYTISLATLTGHGIGYYDAELAIETAEQPLTTIKTVVASDGAIYTLDSENWLSVNGQRVWSKTYDFSVTTDGKLYWQSDEGLLVRRLTNGTWQHLDDDTTKYEVADSGTVYSLGRDGYLSVNGNRAWNYTSDFTIGGDQSLYWHGNGQLWNCAENGAWTHVDNNVTRIAARDDGTVYSLHTNSWTKANGAAAWSATRDFALTENNSLYWLSTDGTLYVLPQNGSWQQLGNNVVEFAVRQDGAVYTLTNSQNVYMNGSLVRSDVNDMRIKETGQLVLDCNSSADYEIAGRFTTGGSYVGASSMAASQQDYASEVPGYSTNVVGTDFGAANAAANDQWEKESIQWGNYGMREGVSVYSSISGDAVPAPAHYDLHYDTSTNTMDFEALVENSRVALLEYVNCRLCDQQFDELLSGDTLASAIDIIDDLFDQIGAQL